jgi:hypothetical protein
MRFAIQGQGGEQALAVFDDQVIRCPARSRTDTACSLEGEQEFMANEWIARQRQRIPSRRGDVIDASENARLHLYRLCFSASIWSRYLSASSAAMQPVPAEVIAWRYT